MKSTREHLALEIVRGRPIHLRSQQQDQFTYTLDASIIDLHVPPLARIFLAYFASLARTFPRRKVSSVLRSHPQMYGATSIRSPALREALGPEARAELELLLIQWLRSLRDMILSALEDVLLAAALAGFLHALRTWAGHFGENVEIGPATQARLREWAHNQSLRLLDQVEKTTRSQVDEIIEKGLRDGRSDEEIIESVRRFLADDDKTSNRIDMIARTESSRASNYGALEANRQLGATEKGWATNPLCANCENCIQNSLQGFVDIMAVFQSGDLAPPAHPRCCCVVTFRGVREEGVQSFAG